MKKLAFILFIFTAVIAPEFHQLYAMEQDSCTCTKKVTSFGEEAYESICDYCRSKSMDKEHLKFEQARLAFHTDILRRQAIQLAKYKKEIKPQTNIVHWWQFNKKRNSEELQTLLNKYKQTTYSYYPIVFKCTDKEVTVFNYPKEFSALANARKHYYQYSKNEQTFFDITDLDLSSDTVENLIKALKDKKFAKQLQAYELLDIIKLADFLCIESPVLVKAALLKDVKYKSLEKTRDSIQLDIDLLSAYLNHINENGQTKLNLSNYHLDHLHYILSHFKNDPRCEQITKLDISGNNLKKLALKQISEIFPNLQRINATNNHINELTATDWETLIEKKVGPFYFCLLKLTDPNSNIIEIVHHFNYINIVNPGNFKQLSFKSLYNLNKICTNVNFKHKFFDHARLFALFAGIPLTVGGVKLCHKHFSDTGSAGLITSFLFYYIILAKLGDDVDKLPLIAIKEILSLLI